MSLPSEPLSPAQDAAADDALLQRVRGRVLAAIAREPQPAHHTVRAGDDGWQEVAPGVARRLLSASPTSESCLLRVAPGAWLPPHAHHADEECVVLAGSVRIGDDLLLQAGDYHLARAGSTHARTRSDTGALVFLRGAPEPA